MTKHTTSTVFLFAALFVQIPTTNGFTTGFRPTFYARNANLGAASYDDDSEDIADFTKDVMAGAYSEGKEFIMDTADTVKDAAIDTKDYVKDAAIDAKDYVKEVAIDTKDYIKNKAGSVKDVAIDAKRYVKDAAVDTKDYVKDKVGDAKEALFGDDETTP